VWESECSGVERGRMKGNLDKPMGGAEGAEKFWSKVDGPWLKTF
jgi:hypothetical protein